MTGGRILALVGLLALAGCSQTVFDPTASQIEQPPPPPQAQRAAVATLGGQTYTVVSGDTIDGLAKQFGVPVEVLIQANGLTSPYDLRAGQELVVPVSGSYTVIRGDNLSRIAKAHGTTIGALAHLNNLSPPYLLKVGQRLSLPGGALATTASGQAGETSFVAPAGTSLVTTETLPPPSGSTPPATSTVSTGGASATETALPPLQPVNPAAPPSAATTPAPAPIEVPVLAPQSSSTASSTPPAPSATTPPSAPASTATSTVTVPASPPAASSSAASPPEPAARGSGKFLWPVNGKVISPFGAKDGGLHNDGINIAAPVGTPVHAADNGVVVYAGNELRGFGNLLLVRHADGWVSAYAHCDALLVKRGDQVKRGQVIARVGQTGNVTAPQLHFELRKGAEAVDPVTELGPQGA